MDNLIIKDDDIKQSLPYLTNVVFADLYILYNKLQFCHWNVTGPDFYSKHQLFERLYANFYSVLDRVAEAIRSLDSEVFCSFNSLSQLSTIDTMYQDTEDFKGDMLNYLLSDIETARGNIYTLNQTSITVKNLSIQNMAADIDENVYANAYYLIVSHLK